MINHERCNRIKLARKKSGYTQMQVAERLNVSVQAVKNWEQGINSIYEKNIEQLAALYGCEVSWLMYGDPKPLCEYTTDELIAEIERRNKRGEN